MTRLPHVMASVSRSRAGWQALCRVAVLCGVLLVALVRPGAAQFDFAGAVSVKFRTYPIKMAKGKPVSGRDGMPQAKAQQGGRPADLVELPALPISERFPGAAMIAGLQRYQKRYPSRFLQFLVALLHNGYVELDIEKRCQLDRIKMRYIHQPTEKMPAFSQAGLAMFMPLVLDGAMAADLQQARDRLRDRYNAGLSTGAKRDQDAMDTMQLFRLAIARRYEPRIKAPGLDQLPRQQAKALFKAEVAKGKPVEGGLQIGPLHLQVRARLDRRRLPSAPRGCP